MRASLLRLIRSAARPAVAALIAAATAASLPSTAGAQADPPEVDLRLLSQPTHHGVDDRLDLRLQIHNRSSEPLNGFQIQPALYSAVGSRTELHESHDGVSGGAISLYTRAFDLTLEPGETTVVTLGGKASQRFGGLVEEGVYPLTISLYDQSLAQLLDSFTTELVYYPTPVEDPLNLVLLVPFTDVPARSPTGVYSDELAGTWPLEEALDPEKGWLRAILDATVGGAERGLAVSVSPSPRLVEEMVDVANGYRRLDDGEVEDVSRNDPIPQSAAAALATLRAVLREERVTPVVAPYVAPDLPTVLRVLELEHLTRQLSTGEAVLTGALPRVQFDPRWFFSPGSRWDEQTLEAVWALRNNLRTFFSADSFESPIDDAVPGCPETSPEGSFTCPVRVPSPAGTTLGFVRDPDIQSRFSELAVPGGDPLDVQRLFAETALIHLEFPGDPTRIIHATIPSGWHPGPVLARRVLVGLTRAPWLKSRTLDGALRVVADPNEKQLAPEAPILFEEPPDTYFETLEDVESELDTFGEIQPPEELVQSLRRNLLVAQSRYWWADEEDDGIDYATETADVVNAELEKITIDGLDTTLTSRRSPLELFVNNSADYPVTVDVDFVSERPGQIRIDPTDNEQLDDVVVEAGGRQSITVEAIAESSGIFRVNALVSTPGTGAEIDVEAITIRSTNFNVVALGITFGALAFLILFYAVRLIKRRASPSATEGDSA
ncbi:MAG: DUF6049 family protein [Actinomycetota bacterium]|nr:DUF6049 family protein [Actinomycetota bacterium]